jgi:hypothetical protein
MTFGRPGDSTSGGGQTSDLFSGPKYARLFLVGGTIVSVSLGAFCWLVPESSSSRASGGWLGLAIVGALVGTTLQVVGRRDALNQARLLGQPAAAPFYYLKLLSPRSLRRAASQARWPLATGQIVTYGLPLVVVSGLIRLAVVAHSGATFARKNHSRHLTPLHIVSATALTVMIFALILAGLLQIRTTAIRRQWGRRERPLDLVARGWGPVSQWRANRDNMAAMQRSWIEWDLRHDFSRRARNAFLVIAAAGAAVAIVAVVIHAVWSNMS